MIIADFEVKYIPQAKEISLENYEMERKITTILPQVMQLPEELHSHFIHFAENGLGVVAIEEGELVGYLCAYVPREDAFGTTNVRGTFSPIHGHGVSAKIIGQQRDRIYSLLYQKAAEKWVKRGIRSQGIALYTHDKVGVNSFFYHGFGLRCIDLIRSLNHGLEVKPVSITDKKLDFLELPREEWKELLELHNSLQKHLAESPVFMLFPDMDEEGLYAHTSEDVRYFAVKANGEYIAYLKLADGGENFVTELPGMINICGAYCRKEFRGSNVYQNLLSYVVEVLRKEGYELLGVDCESLNPTARGFWLKYFEEYTHSLVRRIDEKAVEAALEASAKE